MAILSPAIRLAENRPQSTVGRTASMTARTLPSLATAFPAQNEGRQGRQREAHRFDTAVSTHRDGFYSAQVPPPGAAVYLRVGIDDLAPKPARGNADEKILPRHGRKIAHDQQRRPAVSRLAQKRDNAHLGIADIHPLEALRREIHLVQGRFAAIDAIQIADEPLDAGVFRQAGHPPLEFTFVGPFTALPELHLVQGRFAAIDAIQIADEPLDAGVFRQAGHPPLEFTFVGPFTALPEL